jgi:hypothetical protein
MVTGRDKKGFFFKMVTKPTGLGLVTKASRPAINVYVIANLTLLANKFSFLQI